MDTSTAVALAIFVLTYGLIVFRRAGKFEIPVWTAMLVGASLMILTGTISVEEAYSSVNLDVIFFLIGMFTIVSAMRESGLLQYLTCKFLRVGKSPERILLLLILVMALTSAFFVNDTIALMGTPIAIALAAELGIGTAPLLITLAFGITVGSVMTPIGNPQNLLITTESGIAAPFTTFIKYLAVPTIVNIFATYYVLRILHRSEIKKARSAHDHPETAIKNVRLARISGGVALATVAGFLANEVVQAVGLPHLKLSAIALIGATALLALSYERRELLKQIDWGTIVFFIAMFIVMQSIWNTGLIRDIAGLLPQPTQASTPLSILVILGVSIILSQVLSNVPMVAFYVPLMQQMGFSGAYPLQWMALAAGSTIAGNLTVLGAASNIIILETAESRGLRAFSFAEFLKVGTVVTLVNAAIYAAFLSLFALVGF